MNPFVAVGPTELILVLLLVVLLFGAKKLPELARGSGRALRIFKAETKGLEEDDDTPEDGPEIQARELGPSSRLQESEIHHGERHPRGDTTT